jgi:enoyl-CoA hydratase/carnithine racemase
MRSREEEDHRAVPLIRELRIRTMSKSKSTMAVRVIEETSAYWRVLFDYPPFNIMDATIFEGLQDLLARMDSSPGLRVVVFESANPEFYLAHFDLTGKLGNITTAVGRSGLPILTDTFVRLTTSPVVSIAKIRGCVRGACSEFVLACDMRFASRENTRLGQPEVGVGVHPGGGGTERLPHLVGRGRALEIVLGANDFDGETAERYGYVNRALPDAELDGFVDVLARRIASFDLRAIAAAKNLVNQVSLPSADRLLDALTSFQTTLTWSEAQQRIQVLLERGLQRDGDFENRWPAVLGTLLDK